jgi:hypothetical protein
VESQGGQTLDGIDRAADGNILALLSRGDNYDNVLHYFVQFCCLLLAIALQTCKLCPYLNERKGIA